MTTRPYEAPGPGTWELDATHFSKPITRYSREFLSESLVRGFKEGSERYGLFVSHIAYSFVNGFPYMKLVPAFVPEDAPPGPPPEGFFEQPELVERFENGKKAIEGKFWREDLRRWDEEVKPDSLRRHRQLRANDPEALSREALMKHMTACRDNLDEMFYRHHVFTVPAIIAAGLYVSKASEWTQASPNDVLELLKGSSPVSAGVAATQLSELAGVLKAQGVEPDQFEGQSAEEALQALRKKPAPIGPAVEKFLEVCGMQLTSGYDITERYLLEVPELLMGSIWGALAEDDAGDDDSAAFEQLKQAVRSKVPSEHQAEFDSVLHEARLINRLRDERGVYNEAPAFGLARRAILEAGGRLEKEGTLEDASLLLHAGHDEMLALLRGEAGPSNEELRARADWYENNTTDDAPPFLGPPPQPPPPPEALPENARPAAIAIGAALGHVFDHPEVDDASETPESVVAGLAVGSGVYEGTARLIRNPSDFKRLQKGDVLVTKNTSATFNVVLPLLGAIVTDRGGQLSHAAIVSREYGLPGVVSTRNATKVIPDGARVRVDGVAGTVTILS